MNDDALITINNLSKLFTEDKKNIVYAVHPMSFEIYEGEIFGLVGESGCGKSTLGQMIVKLIKPSSGSIIYNNKDLIFDITKIKSSQEKALRQDIQIIFQDPYSSINPQKTVEWLLEEPLKIHKICSSKQERDNRIDEMLNLVGLDKNYKKRLPHELSGGQRQRVAIAIALILNPKFIVCDEVISALDVSIQAQILNLLKDLQQKFNLTYLFISHNLNVVSYMADRIGVMYLGEFVEIGDAKLLSQTPMHPYTQALFSAAVDISNLNNKRTILKGDLPGRAEIPKGCVFQTRCPFCKELCKLEKPLLKLLDDGRKIACHYANI